MSFPVTKVEFIALKPGGQFADYLQEREEQPRRFGGTTRYRARVDHGFIGGDPGYTAVLIDEFPSRENAQQGDREMQAVRARHLAHRYAILVRYNPKIPNRIKNLHWLSPLLTWWYRTGSEKPLPDLSEYTRPTNSPTNASVEELRRHDPERPVFMMNLNKFFQKAQYDGGKNVSGQEAYSEYSKSILPYLISVRGYPAILGKVVQVLETDSNSPLPDAWDEFIWVAYPSRKHFLRLLTNAPRKGIHHRNAGLKRAVVFPCTEIEG
ncbi:MAG: hypothetical protein AAGN35_03265 [Bacteroidota bacterium]